MAALLLVASVGCARQGVPTGGPEDRRPPVVVRTVPEALSIVTDLNTPIRFEFDERISERVAGGTLASAVSISPRGEPIRVGHDSRAITIRVPGGLRPGQVYRVTLDAAISDLFNNRMTDPFELVFSTGGEPVPTTLAGEVWNRITGQALQSATILATSPDGLVHQATADRDGIFALRYVPAGRLLVVAFEDQNRNGEVDSTEVQGGLPVELTLGDTLLVDLPVLAPDTAAAVASGAAALDSVTAVVTFDDYLDPSAPASEIAVRLSREDGAAPEVERIFHEAGYARFVAAVRDSLARLDSIDAARAAVVADSARALADSARAPSDSARDVADRAPPDTTGADTTRVAPADTVLVTRVGAPTGRGGVSARTPPTQLDPLQGSRPGRTADGRRELPSRRIVVRLSGPLAVDVEYQVDVAGVVNVNGLPGGGGTVPLVRALPVDTTAVDSTAVDTTGASAAPPDTGRVGAAPPDTGRVDTIGRGPRR